MRPHIARITAAALIVAVVVLAVAFALVQNAGG
jgi:hypothetical protein